MILKYIQWSLTNLNKQRKQFLIIVLGFVIGFTAFGFIFSYTTFERCYDDFHVQKEHIYRVDVNYWQFNELLTNYKRLNYNFASDLKTEFPEIKDIVRFTPLINSYVSYEDKYFYEKCFLADSTFFSIFSFKILECSTLNPLSKPNNVMISRSAAKRYFGDENPIGKTMKLANNKMNENYTVNGIFDDVPNNSTLKFDFLFSIHEYARNARKNTIYYTYFLLHDKTDSKRLMEKFPSSIEKELSPEQKVQMREKGLRFELILIPLKDVYLKTSDFREFLIEKGNLRTTRYLEFLGVLILIAIWISIINHLIIMKLEKLSAYKIKRILGSSRLSIGLQVTIENAIIYILGVILSVGLLSLAAPLISQNIDAAFNLTPTSVFWSNKYIVFIIILGLLVITIIPNLVISSFPLMMNSSNKNDQFLKKVSSNSISKTFYYLQLVIVNVCLICVIGFYFQNEHLTNQNLGYNKENVLVLSHTVREKPLKDDPFRQELLNLNSIVDVTSSISIPGREFVSEVKYSKVNDVNPPRIVIRNFVEFNHFNVYEIPIIAGRCFSNNYKKDSRSVVLNKSAVKGLGYFDSYDIIGTDVIISDKKYEVIGVISDYFHEKLTRNIKPMAFILEPSFHSFYSIKYQNTTSQDLLKTVNTVWNKHFSGTPFEYYYLSDFVDEQYKEEAIFNKLLLLSTVIFIIITLLSKWVMTIEKIFKIRRSIAIRKVSGATVEEIIYLLMRGQILEFVVISVIAIPISYFMLRTWLNGYVIHMNLKVFLFLLPVSMLFLVEFLIIFSQLIKAAKTNPVKELKQS